MSKCILIHGINNQHNSKESIEREWSEALEQGFQKAGVTLPADLEFVAAYYGDLLHQETLAWGTTQAVAKPMRASSPAGDYSDEEAASLFLEYQQRYEITDEAIKQELDSDDDPAVAKSMAKGVHKKWLKASARIIERVVPTRGKFVARSFLRQAAAYLQIPQLKERIDDIVLTQVFNGIELENDVVVLSHSLGTVVAYSLLRRLRHQVGARLLVTIGSPLGISIVQKRLGPPLVCLDNVEHWLNISDPEDFVALRAELTRGNFGCGNIENLSHLDNGTKDAHDIKMYLSQVEVAHAISRHLG